MTKQGKDEKMECQTCRFWERQRKAVVDGTVLAHCMVEPPKVFLMNDKPVTVRPVTRPDECCGAYTEVKMRAKKRGEV